MNPEFKFEFIDEFRLNENTKSQIADLLKISFPEEDFHGRTYFKQISSLQTSHGTVIY
ncbi:MAG: hypothetical protein R3A12_17000 [Ignavibacteria bacterium]